MPASPKLKTTQLTKMTDFQTERHTYEKCQYLEFKERVAKITALREAKRAESSD